MGDSRVAGRLAWAFGLVFSLLAPAPRSWAASVIATVPVGAGPFGVAVNPVTDKVYVANQGGNSVSVISVVTNTVIATIPIGTSPFGVAVNPETNRIYVSNNPAGSVTVINGSTDTVLTTIAGVGTTLEDIAVNPMTNKIYVAQFAAGGSVTVINGVTNTILTTVPVGSFSNGVAVNPRTNRVYVSNRGSGTLSVIDGATDAVISTPAAGTSPNGLALDLDLNRIYVTDISAANTVRVIDGFTETIQSSIPVGTGPEGLGFSSSRSRLYVANGTGNSVSVISAFGTVGQTVAVGTAPRGVAVHDDLGRAYVTNNTGNTVSVIADVMNYRSIGVAGPYSVGQVNATQNSRVVTGSGSQTWSASNRGQGDRIQINGVDYTVYRVDSDTQLTLTLPFAQVSGSYGYTISRQYTTLAAWEDCIDGNPCTVFPVASASLVADNRSEVGVAYNDGIFDNVVINGSTPDAVRDIRLTVAPGNRHNGVGTPTPGAGTGVVIDNDNGANAAVEISDPFVTVEWLEVREGSIAADGIQYTVGNNVIIRNNLVHDVAVDGIRVTSTSVSADIIGNIVYQASRGIRINQALVGGTVVRIFNNTVYNCNSAAQASGINARFTGAETYPTVTLRNNIVHSNVTGDIDIPARNAASSHNLTSDATGTTNSPAGGGINSVPLTGALGVNFVSTTLGAENLHILSNSRAVNNGADLRAFFTNDIDGTSRPTPWDIGADETNPTTHYRSIGTAPNDTTGTLTATSGSADVVGAGTSWLSNNRGRGDVITICNDPPVCASNTNYVVASVASNTSLRLDRGYSGPSGALKTFTVRRQFTTLTAWEDCVDGPPGVACPFFPVTTASLVTDDRVEVGIAYKDSVFPPSGPNVNVAIDGSTTDALHTITLTADPGNRHYGIAGTGVILDGGAATDSAVLVLDDFVTVEWLEIRGGGSGFDGVEWQSIAAVNKGVARNLLIHDLPDNGIQFQDSAAIVDVYNNIVYRNGGGLRIVSALSTGSLRIFNNTFYGNGSAGGVTGNVVTPNLVTLRNNIAHSNAGVGDYNIPTPNAASSNNISSDATATSVNPGGDNVLWNNVPLTGVGGINFIGTALGSENLHITTGSSPASAARNVGTNLSAFLQNDIDNVVRLSPWEIGADDVSQTTAVTLQAFSATSLDEAVELSWTTASELQNLGFHLYRSDSASGPYTRVTSSLIPGLGSSPTGQSYSYRDGGLLNGREYFYKLEDVETTGRTEMHGPVSATPDATAGACCSTPPSPASGPAGTSYGDPSSVVLREVERSPGHVVLELLTGGFVATPVEGGRVHLTIPGFESASRPGEPELPMRRALVEAVAGRKVRLASVVSSDVLRFRGLRPTSQGSAEIEVSEEGIALPGWKGTREGRAFREMFPSEWARLLGTSFQGETKKAEVHLSPLRWDGNGLVLSRRLLVRLEFSGTEAGERSRGGSRGRRAVKRDSHARQGVLAQLVVKERGLYRVAYEDLFPTPAGGRRTRGLSTSSLRLSRQGESVAFHVEPGNGPFGPGSSLYFLSEGHSLNPYADAVYELETNGRGVQMEVVEVGTTSGAVGEYLQRIEKEENRYYQAGLLEAPDLWLWDVVVSPGTKSFTFTVDGLSPSSVAASLSLDLQGASDFETPDDHHVRVGVNGVVVGEGRWDGKLPKTLAAEVPAGVLREGENTLELESVGDTPAAYSMVFLDRFSLTYSRLLKATEGMLEGRFEMSGLATVEGGSASAVLLDTTANPRWLLGMQDAASGVGGVSFPVVAGDRYLLSASVLRPEARLLEPSTLKSATNQADYLLLAPQAFLEAAQPLLAFRQGQGLVTKAVSLEEVFAQFGHGETSPLAIKEFLEYAYQFWADPSPRYVLLLGDASYDPKDHLQTGVKDWLPGFPVKTTFLWTVSDPAYAAVNGEDLLPDLAIGRLPAGSVDEARRLVEKVLAFENGGGNFDGPAVLVADNTDLAGNFEQDADEIAGTLLAGRNPRKIYYSQQGGNSRTKIREAFDEGASLMSYMGHGGTVIWASENIFNYQDVNALALQPQQPLLLTLNCLNGFFQFPPLNSLSEALLKAEGKGVIAAFSPSGLSENEAAHRFHKALLEEILSGRHERLGDAVLAAQNSYADTGAFPELLSIYHLFADPALRLR